MFIVKLCSVLHSIAPTKLLIERSLVCTLLCEICAVKGALRILAIDDNPSITDAMPFIFAAPGYELTTAGDANQALEKLATRSTGFDVIIIDQKMPRLTGVELVKALKERRVPAKIIVVSGHLSPEIREAYERMDVHIIFEKPFDIEELRSAVDQLAA